MSYSSIAIFVGKNLIKNKLKYSSVVANHNYAPHIEEVLAYLTEKNYRIVDDVCVPVEASSDGE